MSMGNGHYSQSESTADVERTPPPGRVAIVLSGLAIGILLMGIQLWILTVALDLYLSGGGPGVLVLTLISGLIFLGGLFVLRQLSRHPHFR